jgi:RNAse (barnase) inhibitor barstar
VSGLARLLAGRTPPGVYRWNAVYDVEDVRHTVEHAGHRFAYLDGWVLESKAEVLTELGRALGFGEHYGRNLDALADCLTEVAADTVLLWDGWGPFARAHERTFRTIGSILRARTVATGMSVLLRGDGPEVDLPVLD